MTRKWGILEFTLCEEVRRNKCKDSESLCVEKPLFKWHNKLNYPLVLYLFVYLLSIVIAFYNHFY